MPAGTRFAWRVGGLVSLTLALTCACAAGPTDGDSPASVPGAGPVATLSPPSTDPSTPDVVARMPAAARERTSEGAVAFVRYFMELTNEIGMRPRLGVLRPLSTANCKSCAGLEEDTQALVTDGEHYGGPAVTVESIGAFSGDPQRDGEYRVGVQVTQGGHPILAGNGEVVQEMPRSQRTFIVHLVWRNRMWLTNEIKLFQASRP